VGVFQKWLTGETSAYAPRSCERGKSVSCGEGRVWGAAPPSSGMRQRGPREAFLIAADGDATRVAASVRRLAEERLSGCLSATRFGYVDDRCRPGEEQPVTTESPHQERVGLMVLGFTQCACDAPLIG
jgi:hypothetical protein